MAEVKTATIESFQFQGACVECIPYGSGHINDTFRVTCEDNGTTRRYILQRTYGKRSRGYFLVE